MKHEKMHRINLNVPQWAFIALERVAHDREWTVSHVVRSLCLGSIVAWERESWERDDREYLESHE